MEQERTGFDLTLKKLTVDNFRGFGHLEVPFDKDIIVFIAENGGGKTTILDAIAECLKIFMWQLLKRDFTNPPKLTRKDVKNLSEQPLNAQLDINWIEHAEEDNETSNTKKDIKTNKVDLSLILSVNKSKKENEFRIIEGGTEYDANIDSQFYFLEDFKNHYRAKTDSVPVLVYYGCNSVNTIADTTQDVKEDDLYHIYHGALEPTRFSFQSFFQWFDTQFKISHIPEKKPNKSLEIVCDAIEQMFNDDMQNKNYQNLRMNYQLSGNDMVIDKKNSVGGYDPLDVTQMSAGEKMIFAMVADIAKRLILANPFRDDELDDKNKIGPLFQGKGIVLIDEIDLHLHPKWQRRVLVKLREIFPNVKFIVTTHSPFVVQSVLRKDCIELSNGQLIYSESSEISSYEAIVIDYFLKGDHNFDINTTQLLKEFRKLCFEVKIGKIKKDNSDFKDSIKKLKNKGEEVKNIIAFELRQLL